MKTTDKIVLSIGALLIVCALVKPDLSSFINLNNGGSSSVVELDPVDSETKEKVKAVVDIVKNGPSSRKKDGARLSSLFRDMSTLVSLDGEAQVIKTTNDIRNATGLVGDMLRMDIKSKYPDFAKECTSFVQSMIGEEDVALDAETREKAVVAYRALAWACLEGTK